MTYKQAKALTNEDEVAVKKTGCVLQVVDRLIFNDRDVEILCDDGNWYHHREVC